MLGKNLRERCKTSTNVDTDTFVGIKAKDGTIEINFPLGFNYSKDEKILRKEILLLLNVLAKHTNKRESELNTETTFDCVNLPIQAYLHVILDYYSRGYYKERETVYTVSKKGKINWGRTIKSQKAYIQKDDIIFLDYITKKQNVNENEIVTLIHKSCVYESFEKVGWLFSSFLPEKPLLNVQNKRKYCNAVIRRKLNATFNDRDRELFKNMIAIIDSMGNEAGPNEFRYGTYRFEYVWESLVDSVYGRKDKDKFFPRTYWNLIDEKHENSSLEPDTIMIVNNKVFVLDAKYYKFGWTGKAHHLPESTSINKQITYGEYIAESRDFIKKYNLSRNPIVYNAFIMPYDSYGDRFHTKEFLHYIGTATSDWKASDGLKPYELVAGIMIDIKNLMENSVHSNERIIELATLIEEKIANDCSNFGH